MQQETAPGQIFLIKVAFVKWFSCNHSQHQKIRRRFGTDIGMGIRVR